MHRAQELQQRITPQGRTLVDTALLLDHLKKKEKEAEIRARYVHQAPSSSRKPKTIKESRKEMPYTPEGKEKTRKKEADNAADTLFHPR
jgi:hypothetical protein